MSCDNTGLTLCGHPFISTPISVPMLCHREYHCQAHSTGLLQCGPHVAMSPVRPHVDKLGPCHHAHVRPRLSGNILHRYVLPSSPVPRCPLCGVPTFHMSPTELRGTSSFHDLLCWQHRPFAGDHLIVLIPTCIFLHTKPCAPVHFPWTF